MMQILANFCSLIHNKIIQSIYITRSDINGGHWTTVIVVMRLQTERK